MKNEFTRYAAFVDFRELMAEMSMRGEHPSPLYEAAFLTRDEKNRSEFVRNTSTWD